MKRNLSLNNYDLSDMLYARRVYIPSVNGTLEAETSVVQPTYLRSADVYQTKVGDIPLKAFVEVSWKNYG
jgi:hypothetical protein